MKTEESILVSLDEVDRLRKNNLAGSP